MYYIMVLSTWSPDQMHQHYLCKFLGLVRPMDPEVGGGVVSAVHFINFQVILTHVK